MGKKNLRSMGLFTKLVFYEMVPLPFVVTSMGF